MKPTLLLACSLLASCASFTAQTDPITGIRQDAPESWRGAPDPLNYPGYDIGPDTMSASQPLTPEERNARLWGHF